MNADATEEIQVAGVFIAIGHKPNTDIFDGQLDMKNGYLTIQSGTEGNATQTSATDFSFLQKSIFYNEIYFSSKL